MAHFARILEQAEDAEKDNQADLAAAEEQLKTLGIDKNDPQVSSPSMRLSPASSSRRTSPSRPRRASPTLASPRFYHRRSFRGLDRLRCLRKRYPQTTVRTDATFG